MVSLCQIKARVLIQTVMENLPFLSKSDQPSQSRNGPPSESDWPIQEPPRPMMFQGEPPQKNDPFEFLKNTNPVGLILIGIVIGVLVVSMRPIVIQGK
jgi:hypothetical protein